MAENHVKKELSEVIKNNLRPFKESDFETIPIEVIQYAAGISDSDGCFKIYDNSPEFAIDQAEKGIATLHFMHHWFGGVVRLHKEGNDKHQTSYDYSLRSYNSIKFAQLMLPYLLPKKREAEIFIKFVVGRFMFFFEARNTITNDVLSFNCGVDCANHFGLNKQHVQYKTQNDKVLTQGDWLIKRKYSQNEVEQIQQQRKEIEQQLKYLKTIPHDEIPEDIVPSMPYRAGFFDGEGSFSVNGTSGQHHSISQKYKPILEVFKRLYGGSMWYRESTDVHYWGVNTEAKKLLTDIAPYLHGKKKQAEILLNMKPGEAPQVHVLLRELKKNHNAPTPSVDAIKGGAPGIKASQAKPHKPPKELPTGVFYLSVLKQQVKVEIIYNKRVYRLGTFDAKDVAQAEQLYLQYKEAINVEKRGGPKPDFSGLSYRDKTQKKND